MPKSKRKVAPRRSTILRQMVVGSMEPVHEKYTIVNKILNEDLFTTVFFEIEKIERRKMAKASQMLELNEFFKLAVKSLNYHAFVHKHCRLEEWNLNEEEEEVPKPKIDNWARFRMGVEYQYKKIDLFQTPIKEVKESKEKSMKIEGKSAKRKISRDKFRRMGEEDPQAVGNLNRFNTMEKFLIDGVLDTRFYKGLVALEDKGENLTEEEKKIEQDMRNNKNIRDNIIRERMRQNNTSRIKNNTKYGHFHDIKRLHEDKIPFTTDFQGNPIVVKKPKPYLFGGKKNNPKRFYKVEKHGMTAELAKSILKQRFSTSSTREALKHYLGETTGTFSTQRTISTARGDSARAKSPRIAPDIIRQIKGNAKNRNKPKKSDRLEDTMTREFRERKEKLREEAKIQGGVLCVKQFMMKINPDEDDILECGNTLTQLTRILSDPRALYAYSKQIREYNKILKIGTKILKKHHLKFSTINTNPNTHRITSYDQKPPSSKESRTGKSSVFKKTAKMNIVPKKNSEKEVIRPKSTKRKAPTRKKRIKERRLEKTVSISKPKVKDKVNKFSRKNRIKERMKLNEAKKSELIKSSVVSSKQNIPRQDYYTKAERIDLSGSVGRKMKHYWKSQRRKKARVRSRHVRNARRATSFDYVQRLYKNPGSSGNRTLDYFGEVNLDEESSVLQDNDFERFGEILVRSKLVEKLYENSRDGGDRIDKVGLDDENL